MTSLRPFRLVAVTMLALALCSLGLGTPVEPAGATVNQSIDCATVTSAEGLVWADHTETVTVNFSNCDSYEVYDDEYNFVTSGSGPTGTEVLQPNWYIDFYDSVPNLVYEFTFRPLYPETVPSGSRQIVADAVLPASSPQFNAGADNSGGDDDHWLADDPDCALSIEDGGDHVYSTIEISISKAGTFTFRGVATDPVSDYLEASAPENPINDPFLALYRTFDPTQPDSGVVGCNDDLRDLFSYNGQEMGELLADGTIMEGHQPYFVADLEPGDYTLVLMLWDDIDATEWATYGPATVTFEMWGPEGSLCRRNDTACRNPEPDPALPRFTG